ncbi:MAG TPA: hypothetical protein DEB61_06595 [Alcanivorax sp.]|nr:hypothetical protein [Alcanivorax sp.]MBF47906.1 hypothetical protein [Alcanivorax sp.]MBT75467.1 hypothetical protein [Alcanivorax sp.]HAD46759.1 hypothetical protein [Alcanivorax sp.]HAJ43180.1 hypothetical protein [Alcanivorax sp.]
MASVRSVDGLRYQPAGKWAQTLSLAVAVERFDQRPTVLYGRGKDQADVRQRVVATDRIWAFCLA